MRAQSGCPGSRPPEDAEDDPVLIPPDETFDVGVDTRPGVNDQDYKPRYPFNGAIHGVTFKLGPTQLTELEERTIKEAYAVAND